MTTTIPKIKILKSFSDESQKLDIMQTTSEWFSNTTYSGSKKTFIDIRNVNGKMEVYYCCDKSNAEINLNQMISFKSSHNVNNEIGHHGDGFKRFSFKHNALMEVYSINDNQTFDYIEQDQAGLIRIIDSGIGNSEFERRMDTSEFTTFKKTKDMEDIPQKIKNIMAMEHPFSPKFIVVFKNLERPMMDYLDYTKFESLLYCLKFINYQHIDNIYIRNQFLEKYTEFSEIEGFDIKGEFNYNYEHKFSLYADDELQNYYLSYNDIAFKLTKVINKFEREIISKDDLIHLNYLADITMRETKETLSEELKKIIKHFKKTNILTPSNLLEHYPGIYIVLNNIPISYIASKNEWLPKSGNLPGRSRYRCIVEPKSDIYMSKLIDTEGVKSNSRLAVAGVDWKYIIKSNLNYILEIYRKFYKDTITQNNPLTEDIILGNIDIPKIQKEEGYLWIVSLGNNNYAAGTLYGKTLNLDTILKDIRKQNPEITTSNTSHIIYNKFLLRVDVAKQIFWDSIRSSRHFNINPEYPDHFTCSNYEKIFNLQCSIYKKLIESNIYN